MTVNRYKQAQRITLIGAMANILLGLIKLWGGIVFNSHALLADGVHSFSDLLTDSMVLVAAKFGSQDADDSHPYGHQRFETAATLLLALLLVLAGIGIAWDAFSELTVPYSSPSYMALAIALFSTLTNEALFRYTLKVGNRIQSSLILANAWHHRSDAASSAVVLIGLIGGLLGYAYCDALAALIVGGLIVKMGLTYGWNSVKELVDTAVDSTTLATIETIIKGIDGVKKAHQLRSRSMGGDILIDVHVLVDPFISVSEGHFIAQQVQHQLVHSLKRVNDVMVHIDPEDDDIVCPSLKLPNRQVLENNLLNPWKEEFSLLKNWTIHYLDGKIRIDLLCDEHIADKEELLKARIKQDIRAFPIEEVRITLCKNISIMTSTL